MHYDTPLYDQHIEARDAYMYGAARYGSDRPTLAQLLQDEHDAEQEYDCAATGLDEPAETITEYDVDPTDVEERIAS